MMGQTNEIGQVMASGFWDAGRFRPRSAPHVLNNDLLENGLAERKDAWEFADWNF